MLGTFTKLVHGSIFGVLFAETPITPQRKYYSGLKNSCWMSTLSYGDCKNNTQKLANIPKQRIHIYFSLTVHCLPNSSVDDKQITSMKKC